jgi:hypothetical protein
MTFLQLSATSSPSVQMQGKMMAYDRVVVDLNAARLRGTSFPVIHAFIQAALSLNPDVRAFLMPATLTFIDYTSANASGHTTISYSCEDYW